MMTFDLHMHTTRHSPDSEMDPFDMVHRARELGLQGVVITEHDWLWTDDELEELRSAAPGLVVLAGMEVSSREGHILVYGIHDPFMLYPGIGIAELCEEVHAQNGAAVAAHPFRWGQPFDEIVRDEQPELDGMELMSSNMDDDSRKRAAEFIRNRPWAGLGCSDAHHETVLGVCYTEFAATIRNSRDLVEAIRDRKTMPRDRLVSGLTR
jgi:predicted metal-dependent phosphoesterase TrpH